MAEGVTKSGDVSAELPVEQRTLLVQGLPPDMSEELLELYFENPKCGGGEVESVTIEDFGKARVVFGQRGGKMKKVQMLIFGVTNR